MTEIGTGTTITFATSGFTADILEFAFSRVVRHAVRTTHFLTPQAGPQQFGGHTWMPVKLVDPGYLLLTVAFNPQISPPINGQPELITLTFPREVGYATASRLHNLGGFLTDWRIGVRLEQKMTASIEIKLSGIVYQTVGTLLTPTPGAGLLSCLMAHWALEETTGSTRQDSHTNNLDLTDNNSVPQVAGKVGFAGGFTFASSQSLTLAGGSASLLSFGNTDFSVACWVNLTAPLVLTSILVSKGTPIPSTNFMEFQLAFNIAGASGWQFLVGNGAAAGAAQLAGPLDTGVWRFLVGRHDSVANTVDITVNGPATFAGSPWSGGSYLSGLGFAIGQYGGFAGGFSDALIDEVSIFNCVLSDAEILHLYNSGAGRAYPFT